MKPLLYNRDAALVDQWTKTANLDCLLLPFMEWQGVMLHQKNLILNTWNFLLAIRLLNIYRSARSGSDTCWLTIKSMPVRMGVVSRHGDWCLNGSPSQAPAIMRSELRTGGNVHNRVLNMPVKAYAIAQKGKASGSSAANAAVPNPCELQSLHHTQYKFLLPSYSVIQLACFRKEDFLWARPSIAD